MMSPHHVLRAIAEQLQNSSFLDSLHLMEVIKDVILKLNPSMKANFVDNGKMAVTQCRNSELMMDALDRPTTYEVTKLIKFSPR